MKNKTKPFMIYLIKNNSWLIDRSQTATMFPRVSPHYCFAGGVKFPQGEGSAVIHREKNDLIYKDAKCLCHSLWESDFTCHREQVVNRLKIPQGLSTLYFAGGVKFPQGEGSAVVHRKKNDLLYKRATSSVSQPLEG